MSKEDIYGRIDHGNAAELTSDALSNLGKSESNKINGPVKDSRINHEREDQKED